MAQLYEFNSINATIALRYCMMYHAVAQETLCAAIDVLTRSARKSTDRLEAIMKLHPNTDALVHSTTCVPKYLTARDAAHVYGVHRDFFRKTPELRHQRIVLTSKTHLYPVTVLDAYFSTRRAS